MDWYNNPQQLKHAPVIESLINSKSKFAIRVFETINKFWLTSSGFFYSNPIIILVPGDEFLDSLFHCDLGGNADGFVEGGAVGASFQDVSRLHGQQFALSLFTDRFIDGFDELLEGNRFGRTDVVYPMGRRAAPSLKSRSYFLRPCIHHIHV